MATTYSPRIVTNGLIMYLDSGNRKSYQESGTTWYDLTKYNHNALLTGIDETNFNNGIITFNTGEYGTVTATNTTNIQGSMTVALYTKSLSTGWTDFWCGISKYNQFILGPNTFTPKRMSFLVHNGGTWYPIGYNGDVWGQSGLDLEEYHYYVGVYDEDISKLYFYVDGELEVEHDTASIMSSDTGNFDISKRDGFSNYLKADIGIAQLYNRNLSGEEVKQNYNTLKNRFQ